MKEHIKLCSSIFLFLVLSIPAFSQTKRDGDDIKKKRTINKSYKVSSEDKLDIENQFGNVVVNVWDKNEITVDIEIGAQAPTEERAQRIMDDIDVKDWQGSHTISFKTKVGEIQDNGNGKKRKDGDENRSFYIDYVIHMPATNRLELENSFGKVEVPDFKGPITLTSKFGSLTAGKLDNVEDIDVEFGKATIAEVNNGKVAFKFNNSGSRIGKVNGNVKITSEFSSNVQFNVADNIQELSLFESYSGVRMVVARDLSASIDVHTSFGSFHNESDFSIREHREDMTDYGPHFDKDYSGKAGDGKARIKIKSSFGSVRLSHTAATMGRDRDRDKDKDKDDDKDTKTS